MSDRERAYYLQRAEEELEVANRAHDYRAAKAHGLLAGLYFDLAFNSGDVPCAGPQAALEPA